MPTRECGPSAPISTRGRNQSPADVCTVPSKSMDSTVSPYRHSAPFRAASCASMRSKARAIDHEAVKIVGDLRRLLADEGQHARDLLLGYGMHAGHVVFDQAPARIPRIAPACRRPSAAPARRRRGPRPPRPRRRGFLPARGQPRERPAFQSACALLMRRRRAVRRGRRARSSSRRDLARSADRWRGRAPRCLRRDRRYRRSRP